MSLCMLNQSKMHSTKWRVDSVVVFLQDRCVCVCVRVYAQKCAMIWSIAMGTVQRFAFRLKYFEYIVRQ